VTRACLSRRGARQAGRNAPPPPRPGPPCSAGVPVRLLYSHDTFGLGHLRRSRALAQAITRDVEHTSALILTGSPVAGRFTFPHNVDHVRLPGVTKRHDGSYASQALDIDIDDTTDLRAALIEAAAREFRPDILIVDKEPSGFRGELVQTLETLRAGGRTQLVLGLRDVLDQPETLAGNGIARTPSPRPNATITKSGSTGWRRSMTRPPGSTSATQRARGCTTQATCAANCRNTARPTCPKSPISCHPRRRRRRRDPRRLVLSAYEQDPDSAPKAVLVYGPFLAGETGARSSRPRRAAERAA
jgi:hypothetical protein